MGQRARTWPSSTSAASRSRATTRGARARTIRSSPVTAGQAARGAGVRERPDPQRPGVQVLPRACSASSPANAGTTGATSRCSRSGDVDYPINEEILSIQKIVLNQCLRTDVLARLARTRRTQVDDGDRAAPDRRGLPRPDRRHLVGTRRIRSRAPAPTANARSLALSTLRRNLQREYLRRLCTIVLGQRRGSYDDLYAFILFSGGQPCPRRRAEPRPDAPEGDRRADRQDPATEELASTTPPAPISRSAATGSTRSLTRGSTPTSPELRADSVRRGRGPLWRPRLDPRRAGPLARRRDGRGCRGLRRGARTGSRGRGDAILQQSLAGRDPPLPRAPRTATWTEGGRLLGPVGSSAVTPRSSRRRSASYQSLVHSMTFPARS